MNIKFRCWHKIEKRFIEVRNIDFEAETVGYDSQGEPDKYETEKFENLVFQKGSGQLDIQGVEFFEGDLVEFVFATQRNPETGEQQGPKESFGIYEVFYRPERGAFFFRVHKKNWFDAYFITEDRKIEGFDQITITELPILKFGIGKIIGNIFEK